MTRLSSRHILIIDDDSFIAEIIQASLEMKGQYQFKVCKSGKEALENYEKFQPDLIILDLLLEDMDGIDLLKKFQQIPAIEQLPIIVLTGSDERNTRRNALNAGATCFIQKPFIPQQLSNTINQLLES